MPPPNVTGILHFGHVLNHTLQDLYIRWNQIARGLKHAGSPDRPCRYSYADEG